MYELSSDPHVFSNLKIIKSAYKYAMPEAYAYVCKRPAKKSTPGSTLAKGLSTSV